ncbi:hypothetical protein [Marinicellulosiphila megalodicopiae]|uniref:hypothetical protein n=1 Tax=Marinicellulosiphila megalodicopiae TaxID=2724896 RepID=UPI003BAE2256
MFNITKNKQPHLLNQYKTHLSALLDRTLLRTDLSDTQKELLIELCKTLDNANNWQVAYDIELQIIEHLDEDELQACWSRKLADKEDLTESLQKFYKTQSELKLEGSKLKSMLAKLVCDLQWRFEVIRVRSNFAARTRFLIACMFLLSFFIFFTPTLTNTFLNIELFKDNLRLYYLFTAASAGLLGASFSQLTSMRTNLSHATIEQIRTMSHFSYVVARGVIGAGAGLIMFYIIQSGLFDSVIFPKFIVDQSQLLDILQTQQAEQTRFTEAGGKLPMVAHDVMNAKTKMLESSKTVQVMATAHSNENLLQVGSLQKPSQGISLLIVWCIVAGFSEKLIPGLLNNAEKKALAESEKAN